MATVSVVIVSWNAAGPLASCLGRLPAEADEVIVVDNASTDGSADLVAHSFPWVRLLRQTTNLGFAGGVNAGAAAAHGDHLLLLNSDAEADAGAIRRLGRFLDERPDAGAVAGRLVNADGSAQRGWNVRRLPTVAGLAAELLLIDRLWPGNPWRRHRLALDLDEGAPTEVEQPAAACLMVRRSAFERVGGFDERFFPAWFEDVDFCRRFRAAGEHIWFLPDARFRHRGGVARDRLGRAAFAVAWHGNLVRYVDLHHGTLARLAIRGATVVGLGLRVAACLASGDRDGARAYRGAMAGTLSSWRTRGVRRREANRSG